MTNKPQFVGEKQSLENRVEYVRGVTYKAAVDLHEELDENGYVLLRANNIQEGELRFDDVQYVDRTKVKPKQLLRRGDILFCASSGSKGLVGKAALVRESMPVTFGAFCCVLRPKGNEAEYLGHYFQSRQYRRAIEEVCSGSNINNLKAANFLSLIVPNYDGDSTRAISALFDLIDAQVKQAKDQIAQLDFLVKSRFVELFGDCTVRVSLGEVCFFKSGKTLPKEKEMPSGDYLYAKVGDLNLPGNERTIRFSRSYVDAATAKRCLIPKGAVVFPKRGGAIGTNKKRITGEDCCLDLNLMSVIPGEKIRTEYLLAWFEQMDLADIANGSTVPQINNKDLNPLTIALPKMELQQEFADFVAQVDKSRFIAQQQIEKLQMLYDSLAQEYFGD